jgi:hypothetical protein
MNTPQDFTEWTPKGPSGKYEKYDNQCVVIISRGHGKKAKGKIYLTKKVLSILGHPKFVGIATRGNNTFIMAKNEKDANKYAVMKPDSAATAFCAPHSYIDAFGIREGVYNAVIDNGMIMFDRLSHPSE